MNKALATAQDISLQRRTSMLESLQKLRQHLLTGVSYAIPFIACGGILIAAAIAFAPMTGGSPDFSHAPRLKLILDIGSASLMLMLPVLEDTFPTLSQASRACFPAFLAAIFRGK